MLGWRIIKVTMMYFFEKHAQIGFYTELAFIILNGGSFD